MTNVVKYGLELGSNDFLIHIGKNQQIVGITVNHSEIGYITLLKDDKEAVTMNFEQYPHKQVMLKVSFINGVFVDSIDLESPCECFLRFIAESILLKKYSGCAVRTNDEMNITEKVELVELVELFVFDKKSKNNEQLQVLTAIIANADVVKVETLTEKELLISRIYASAEAHNHVLAAYTKLAEMITTSASKENKKKGLPFSSPKKFPGFEDAAEAEKLKQKFLGMVDSEKCK